MQKIYTKPNVSIVRFDASDATNSVIIKSGITPTNGIIETGKTYSNLNS